ncbi:MAG: hypothetical protein ACE5I1_29470 [bacterium]
MKQPLSHRWVLYFGRQAQTWYSSFLWLFIPAIAFLLIFFFKSNGNFYLIMAFFLFILALVWFERRVFYRIIQSKDQEIEKLKSQIPKNA